MSHTRKTLAVAALAVALAVACSNDEEGRGDAPVGNRSEAPRDIIVMPDGFANVAHACDGVGHRIFVTTREAAPVVLDDPTCAR